MAGGAARRRAAKRRAAESLSSQPPDEPPPLLDGPLSIPPPSPPLRCPGLPPPPHYICTFIPVAFTLYNLATAGACFHAFIGLLMGFFVLCSGATAVLYHYNVMFATQSRLMVARMVLLSILMACNLHHGTEVYASQEFLASLHIASCVVVLLLGCPFGTSAMLLFTWASFLVVALFVFNAKN
ncbi:hypothetical protein HPP92_008783 [Vanilla planifolia]|uniref:Uncharacterized protein n=1 Tax=Vanilla planifolia TaxID=51239 RepID=A0A835RA99_VANPL|nr:hypothetical protein HPP92_008783 [Vanilla planifolia]